MSVVADEEFIKSARLSEEQAKKLDELNIPFKELVDEAIDGKSKQQKTTNKKELINKLMTNGVFAIIGLCFLSALNFQSNTYSILIVGGLGGFFTIMGSINLYLTIREIKGGKKIARK
jgi:hypothetical protein